MKNIITAAVISMVALVGCTSQSNPSPTVTITEQDTKAYPLPSSTDDGILSDTGRFFDFMRENGGIYGKSATEEDLVILGKTVCEAYSNGLSDDEITYILAQALVENNMNNNDGVKFGAALLVGSKMYLCVYETF